jgi:hypothetical protein
MVMRLMREPLIRRDLLRKSRDSFAAKDALADHEQRLLPLRQYP